MFYGVIVELIPFIYVTSIFNIVIRFPKLLNNKYLLHNNYFSLAIRFLEIHIFPYRFVWCHVYLNTVASFCSRLLGKCVHWSPMLPLKRTKCDYCRFNSVVRMLPPGLMPRSRSFRRSIIFTFVKWVPNGWDIHS